MPTSQPADVTEPLEKLVGINVKDFDWAPLIKDLSPATDALANYIPGDQHAVFFPTFGALVQSVDLADKYGTPILQLSESRGENALTRDRYQQQMCLPLSQVARMLGPQVIESVAITGGDPYFRTGTDVAVLFAAKSPAILKQYLQARIAQACMEFSDAKPLDGNILGVSYNGARSPDRRICAYVSQLDDMVVVTNSAKQLQRLIEVHQSAEPSLAHQPEYKFFRHRYARGEKGELAFLVLTDKTIRRWCGPKWRIATSRRTRAAALLSDIQAQHAAEIVRGKVQPAESVSEFWIIGDERQSLTAGGATSAVYGDLGFQTPINELEFELVTADEARLYARWRDAYQQNWSTFFDPIAIRFAHTNERLSADVTVMPLIDNSDYRQYVEVSKGAKIGAAGDFHADALAHTVLALNPESEMLKQYSAMAGALSPQIRVNPLSWLGNAIAVYVDPDPIWLEASKSESAERFAEENYYRFPVAFHAEVRNGLQLTAFLVGLGAFVEQTAPGMTVWENLEYQKVPYVKITPSDRGKGRAPTVADMAVYYCASGESLVLTFHEGLLKRAIDRQLSRQKAEPPEKELATPWLGDNFCLRLDGQFHKVLATLYRDQYQRAMQQSSWSNLPILNEWKREFPDLDPVKVHEQLWSRRPICPAGEYRWNEARQTMESTVYGHPGEPGMGPELPTAFLDFSAENFGVTFEEHGLRARVELTKAPRK